MFYRVDYSIGILLLGLLIGQATRSRVVRLFGIQLTRSYWIAAVVCSILRAIANIGTMVAPDAFTARRAAPLLGDLLGLLFGFGIGLLIKRSDNDQSVLRFECADAFCAMLAFSFALSGVAKALSFSSMSEFFVHSGYSVEFLKFILIAEVFGALGLLIRSLRLIAIVGLLVDMFGAITTHIHNGDALNDNTGAIGMIVRLVITGIVIAQDAGSLNNKHVRSKLAVASAATIGVCATVASVGAMVLRGHK